MKYFGFCFLVVALATQVFAADFISEGGKDFKKELAELENMLTSRDLDIYELDFHAKSLDRIVLSNRLEEGKVYHYIVFRLRNKTADSVKKDIAFKSPYNEVLAEIADEYSMVTVDGNQLKVATKQRDDRMNVIVDKDELKNRSRTVYLSAIIYDENGTRLDQLDDIYKGEQNSFDFYDEGVRRIEIGMDAVRKKIENKLNKRLRLPSEISKIKLPKYDSSVKDAEGVSEGEVFGVFIFDRLDRLSDKFDVKVRGLSNKTRLESPPHKKSEVANYLRTRVKRRMFVLKFRRYGDEFMRDIDTMNFVEQGWEWDNTFQEIKRRHHSAHAKYYLENIADEKNRPNKTVEEEFWNKYIKEEFPNSTKISEAKKKLEDKE